MLSKKDKEIRIGTLLGKGTEIEGDFSSEGSARIDGTIRGNVTVDGSLIIGATGSILGNIFAKSILVGGEVIGNIDAPDKIELASAAKVLGDITTNMVVIDEHAVFQGRCDMNQNVPDRKTKSKAVRASKKSAKAAIAEALKDVEDVGGQHEEFTAEMDSDDII